MKKILTIYKPLLFISPIIIFLDQLTKYVVRTYLLLGESWSPWDWLTPHARIIHWKNTGVAFGLGQSSSFIYPILISCIALAILVFFHGIPKSDWPLRIALSMQFGGAIGNLIDRFARGHVTDFISVGRFPVFNIADSSISIGVAVLLIGMLITSKREKREPKNNSS